MDVLCAILYTVIESMYPLCVYNESWNSQNLFCLLAASLAIWAKVGVAE